jgi:hypothetical protein
VYSPDHFNACLRDIFGDQLRLRRSEVRDTTFFLEERTGRGTFTGIADLKDKSSLQAKWRADERIRARDGYSKVMEVQVGSRSACTRCGTPYVCPQFHTAEVRCTGCADQIYTAFFPLGELLLDYLKKIDPTRANQLRRVRDEEQRQQWLEKCETNTLASDAGHAVGDALIEQIPSARYSGHTSFWEDAPSGPPPSR